VSEDNKGKAVANQTFHYETGTIWGGQEFDRDDPLVGRFSPLFNIQEDPEAPLKRPEDVGKPTDNYEEQPISVLRNLAKSKKLDQNGTKADLVERLRKSDRK
jgi:SAP domain